MKISVVSGVFDPIHSGHIAYISEAKKYGDYLVVALNSDAWLRNKKGREFMPFSERKMVLENLKAVDEVIAFEDDDAGSCIKALEKIKLKHPGSEIIFCNGGDRSTSNIPEMTMSGIIFKFGVGGEDKKNSSSWILKNWQGNSEDRVWGKFFNLYQDKKMKLKELIIEPKKGMSLQRHFKRDEIWFVSKGECRVKFKAADDEKFHEHHLKLHDVFKVSQEDWHQIFNPYRGECKIIEIQYGAETSEDDIERMKREAEEHAEEDKKRKELIDAKNEADSLVYSTEKLIKDNGDKVSDETKKKIEDAAEELKKAIASDDLEKINAEKEAFQKIVFRVFFV